ncbi:MAG: aspartyl protease family protein [Patescibacteria group bacterium]
MKFDYKRYGKTLRPVIPVKVRHGETEIGYHVLVDSGADLCIFHEEIGTALGINVRTGEKREVFGGGGKASFYYLHTITLSVGGWPYKIEAGFMPNVSGHVMEYGVVGQRGFFDLFVVKFDLMKEEIELKPRT